MYSLRLKLALTFYATCLLSSAFAQLTNITIDDANADPFTGATIQYSPFDLWKPGSGPLCPECIAHPDPDEAFDGTWHEGASDVENQLLTASVDFTGTLAPCVSQPHPRRRVS